jgi:hypothetical protein
VKWREVFVIKAKIVAKRRKVGIDVVLLLLRDEIQRRVNRV